MHIVGLPALAERSLRHRACDRGRCRDCHRWRGQDVSPQAVTWTKGDSVLIKCSVQTPGDFLKKKRSRLQRFVSICQGTFKTDISVKPIVQNCKSTATKSFVHCPICTSLINSAIATWRIFFGNDYLLISHELTSMKIFFSLAGEADRSRHWKCSSPCCCWGDHFHFTSLMYTKKGCEKKKMDFLGYIYTFLFFFGNAPCWYRNETALIICKANFPIIRKNV